ncbi:amidohydrolase family protein [Kribbella sp. NBC_01245]|uniref:amidohydrolase family protein n=1 Tax=Kribbella sp. NBC_01245 TaxID=2903578 RepID=UPI002E2A4CB2|nr:amidohydrolase family protein [Kribbella sp. NBC_01245]
MDRRRFLGWLSSSGLTFAAAGVFAGSRPAAAAGLDVIVYTGATLIDGTGVRPQPNSTIVTVNGRIAAVGNHRVAVPAGVRVVELRAKYVIPGLIDMHAHTVDLEKIFLPLYVANGVTSIREMWGKPLHHAMRRRIDAGELLGPRMVVGSKLVDGPTWEAGHDTVVVTTAAQARDAVRQAKDEGADFVKVMSHLNDETLTAVAQEATELGLSFSGHLPDEVTTERGSQLGMRTMEHLFGLSIDVSSRRDEFRRRIAELPIDPANPLPRWFFVRELEREAHKSYDPRRAGALFATLKRRGTVLDATLDVGKIFCLPPERYVGTPRTKYLPAWMKQNWDAMIGVGTPWSTEQIAAGQAAWDASHRLAAEAHRAGVTITAGTDCGLPPYGFPGFSLHDELSNLVNSGLPPIAAIQAATRNAARAAGIHRVAGTIEVGKSADLLVLDADPLADIRNTERIHAVVAKGRLITSAERARMLAEVEAEARTTPPPAAEARSCCGLVGPA